MGNLDVEVGHLPLQNLEAETLADSATAAESCWGLEQQGLQSRQPLADHEQRVHLQLEAAVEPPCWLLESHPIASEHAVLRAAQAVLSLEPHIAPDIRHFDQAWPPELQAWPRFRRK